MTLNDLPRNVPATITGFADSDHDMQTRLREIGFAEGDRVESLHFGLFGRNPMSVRLNGALIAMRKREAKAVLVELLTDA